MRPTTARAISVITSPEANATCTTPCGYAWTMSARLRIVRSGSGTTIVARPGRSAVFATGRTVRRGLAGPAAAQGAQHVWICNTRTPLRTPTQRQLGCALPNRGSERLRRPVVLENALGGFVAQGLEFLQDVGGGHL